MPHDPRAWLDDARRAAGLIARFTAGRTVADYAADDLLRSAVERQFEILGEALNRLAREKPDLASRIPDCRRAIDFRNVLIHGYDRVDDAIVWDVVCRHLPTMAQRVSELLNELNAAAQPPPE